MGAGRVEGAGGGCVRITRAGGQSARPQERGITNSPGCGGGSSRPDATPSGRPHQAAPPPLVEQAETNRLRIGPPVASGTPRGPSGRPRRGGPSRAGPSPHHEPEQGQLPRPLHRCRCARQECWSTDMATPYRAPQADRLRRLRRSRSPVPASTWSLGRWSGWSQRASKSSGRLSSVEVLLDGVVDGSGALGGARQVVSRDREAGARSFHRFQGVADDLGVGRGAGVGRWRSASRPAVLDHHPEHLGRLDDRLAPGRRRGAGGG